MQGKLIETHTQKLFTSPDYKFVFHKRTGKFARWGKTEEDDPTFSPFGPEIADIEISTICHGIHNTPCKFCYKANTGKGENMSLDTFKTVFSKFPRMLTQIAFGIGDLDANPDLWSILEYTRSNGVIPNITVNGARLTVESVERLASLCGAIAVSRYAQDENVCYDAVQRLTAAKSEVNPLQQVNIHALLAEETLQDCHKVIDDVATDSRLSGLTAIVFLALKPQGRGTCWHPMRNAEEYRKLVEHATERKVNIGFDSCSAPMFLEAMKDHANYKMFSVMAEPCESMLFSIYIDVFGKVLPCSFCEGRRQSLDILTCQDFLKDIWNSEMVTSWKKELLSTALGNTGKHPGCRQCPVFDIY